jgi:catechol 2,3-dioxygenase-like lactoylglutathione lyase family enzyme
MLDHITINVRDLRRAKNFYDQALRPLGIECLYIEVDGFVGYGASSEAFFWLGQKNSQQTSVHVAFRTEDRGTVDRFYEEALNAGGQDNGPPGIRACYHPDYYGAFVLDPDGHNIEAVCHTPSAEPLP